MTTVLLGNPNPQMQVDRVALDAEGNPTVVDRISVPAAHLNQSVTRVDMRDGFDDSVNVALALSTGNDRLLTMIARGLDADHQIYAVGVLEIEQLMQTHSAGDAPSWVSCPDDPDFEAALAAHFGCPVGEPTALLTSAGRDALHAQHMSTSAQPASFNYMAISANTAAESAANTSLPGEITTAGGGLVRAQATYAHTAGTNTSTLTKTFTANGSDSLPVTIAKVGVLNAASSGTFGYEKLLGSTATLSAVGDNVAITDTITAG